MLTKPADFDGEKFAKKYNLDPFKDFCDDGKGHIICPSLPNLTDADLLDCVTVWVWVSPPYQEFDKPIKAPDFLIASPEPETNAVMALEAVSSENKKRKGTAKTLGGMVRNMAVVIEEQDKLIKSLIQEVEKLKVKK